MQRQRDRVCTVGEVTKVAMYTFSSGVSSSSCSYDAGTTQSCIIAADPTFGSQ